MFVKKNLKHQFFLIVIIFCLSLTLRFFGQNWDQSEHLHPDERFLTMLVSTIQFPNSISQYFNTTTSPLNPFNYQQFSFFVYGTFPIFLTKIVASAFNLDNYQNIHLVGRSLSALFDSLNIFSLYFLAKLIFPKNKRKYLFLPALLYAFAVLPIQLSHFFAVDTFLTFFLFLSLVLFSYWSKTQEKCLLISASIAFGLSLSCKLSAALFLPIILLIFIYQFIKKKPLFFINAIISLLIMVVVFRIFQPYSFVSLFKINPDLIKSLVSLKSILANKDVYYPPEIQWLTKISIVFPLQNIVLWGLGLPVSFLLLLSFKNIITFKLKKIFSTPDNFIIALVIVWTLFLFIEQGMQFTHTMRYFLPIYPSLCLLAILLNFSWINHKKIFVSVFVFHVIYCFLFLTIYTHPHSRVQATNWINQNIPSGSNLANEYWDDPLPLASSSLKTYEIQMLSLYDPDTELKWQQINSVLDKTNYIILSSNRLWGSIPTVPGRYPITTKYYQDLFGGQSEFKKIIEFNSYPGLSLPFFKKCLYFGPTNYPLSSFKNNWFEADDKCNYPGIYLRDDVSEEAFTVYDHPKVIIFKK